MNPKEPAVGSETPLTDAARLAHYDWYINGPDGFEFAEALELALHRRDELLRECLGDLIPKPNRYPDDLIARIERELEPK